MLAFSFDPDTDVIILSVKIKARTTAIANLVLDTGASNVIISKKLAKQIGLNINLSRKTPMTTASKVEKVPRVTIPEISVLGRSVKNVEGRMLDLPQEAGVDGLLGLSFLKHFKLAIDFKNGELSLE